VDFLQTFSSPAFIYLSGSAKGVIVGAEMALKSLFLAKSCNYPTQSNAVLARV
jgi:hypothetical protein